MVLLVIRHTDAGDRSEWAGDDRLRPLSDLGRAQADALVAAHTDQPVTRVLTSPYIRCRETVEPLARARGIRLEDEDALAEGAAFDAIDRAMRALDGDVALCSHGDVIGAIVTDLDRRGVDLGPRPAWPKASTWLLDGWPPTNARFVDAPDVG